MDLLQTIGDVDHDDGSPPNDTPAMDPDKDLRYDSRSTIQQSLKPSGQHSWVCWTYSPHRVLGYYSNHQTINSNTQIADKYSGINHSTLTHHYSTYHTTPDSHTYKIILRLDTIQHKVSKSKSFTYWKHASTNI